jgi:hypothetical protein
MPSAPTGTRSPRLPAPASRLAVGSRKVIGERIEKEVNLARDEPPRRLHRPDALIGQGTVGKGDLHKPDIDQIIAYVPCRQLHYAHALNGSLVQRLHGIGGKAARHGLSNGPAIAFEGPVVSGGNGKALVLPQVRHLLWGAMLRQICRGRIEPAVIVGEAPRDQRAVPQFAEADSDIDTLRSDVDHSVAQQQLDLQARMLFEEGHQHRRQHLATERNPVGNNRAAGIRRARIAG